MEMPWARRKALVSRIHKIDTGILTGFAGMHNFNQFFGLRYKESVKFPDGIDDNMENFISDCSELLETLKEIQVPYKKFGMLAKKFDDLIQEL